jgi:AI-2 transport protein TqsA
MDDTPQDRRAPPRAAGPREAARLRTALLAGILVLLAGWALRATAVVVVPLVSALFIAVTLAPLDRAVAARLPGWLAWIGRVVVVGLLLFALALFFAGLVYAAQQVVAEMPEVSRGLSDILPAGASGLDALERSLSGGGAPSPEALAPGDGAPPALRDLLEQVGSVAGGWIVEAATALAQRIAGAVGSFVAATIIVVFIVLLSLGEGALWRRKLAALWPGDGGSGWTAAIETLSVKLRRFLLMRLAMGALSAALYVSWLWLFDVRLLTVWALLTLLLSFVPNLGSVISGVLPTLYVFVTHDPQTAVAIGAGLFAIEQVVGNFVDPRLQGRQVALSPLVVLTAILAWGWIWGVAGALLAVPMTLAVMVICAQWPGLRPLALLLSDQPDERRLMAALAR